MVGGAPTTVNETVAEVAAPVVSVTVKRRTWEPAVVGVNVGPCGIHIDGLPPVRMPETLPEKVGQVPGHVCHAHSYRARLLSASCAHAPEWVWLAPAGTEAPCPASAKGGSSSAGGITATVNETVAESEAPAVSVTVKRRT